ncbi:MAG: sigma-70 family RNA polymerase sigma factor, partial [Planctomycetota bacterium]
AVCLRRLGHEADARDATQDTFVKLARSAGDIRAADGSVVGWLHRCATTTSIDLMRSESRRRGRERAAAVADRVDASDLPWHDVRSSLDEALGELPDAQRDLIVQRYLMGRTQAHLAAEADISPSMMSRRVHAALDALRERLRGKGFGIGLAALTSGLGAEAAVALPANLSAALLTTATTAAATTATAHASAALPASSSAALPSASGGFTSVSASGGGGGGWLWLGTKIKLSTAILGSLGIHAALVGVVLWLGPGLSTLVTPSAPAPSSNRLTPQPASQPVIPNQFPVTPTRPPRPADTSAIVRVADAEAEVLPSVSFSGEQLRITIVGDPARPEPHESSFPADEPVTLKQVITSINWNDNDPDTRVSANRSTSDMVFILAETTIREVLETPVGDTMLQSGDIVQLGNPVGAGVRAEPELLPLVDPALEGVWIGVEVNDPDVTRTLTIRGNTLDLRAVDGPEWYMVEVVASIPEADPPRFNCVIRDAPADFLKGQPVPIIMKREQIDGRKVLTYASLGPGATDYPEDFEPGNGSRVFRFEKQPAPEEANVERFDATQDDRGSSGGFEPSILDPALTGEWLMQVEDRQGSSVIGDVQPWAENAKMVFQADEIVIYLQDGERIRFKLSQQPDEAGQPRWFQTVVEAPADLPPFASELDRPRPLSFVGHRIEGDRVYAQVQFQNPDTGELETIPAGGFNPLGHRQLLVRPGTEWKRNTVTASGADGEDWRTATLFDWELPSETAGKLLDVETGRITPWSQGGGQRALLASMEREGYDLHVDFNDGDWAHLVSDSWYANATTSTPVSRFPFEITLLTAEGGGMDVAIDSEAAVDAAAGSVTLRYRPVVNRLGVSALESGGRLSESNDRIEFERWSLRDLIQQAHNPMSWTRTRVEELELPLDQRYDGRVVAADPKAALRELLTLEFGFDLRRVVEPTEGLVLRLPADGTHRLTPSDPDRTKSGATGHRDYTQFTGMNSQSLAANLEHRVPGPVIDETGLAGEWDFRLPRFEGDTLAEAATMIRESLGFEVSIETRPVEFFVIEPLRSSDN